MTNILNNYDKRVNILGSYFLLSKIVSDRQKYKEFNNEEFYNIMFQTLCFIFNKSLRREYCFRDDIKNFITDLNILIYKKNFTLEEIDDLTVYLTKGLTNNGKAYMFPYFSIEANLNLHKTIQIVETNIVVVGAKERLTYKLTTEGYRLLLATKEYDELFQIRISQTLARLRLTMDDYDGAKNEVYDIINSLEIQRQKIDNFIKMLRADINHIREQNYSSIVDETLNVLTEEMDKYNELKQEALMKLQDKESYLEDTDGMIEDKIKVLRKKLTQLKEFIDGIDAAKSAASRLITRVQKFDVEHRDILNQLLRAPNLKKFNFKEEILDRLENDINSIEYIKSLYVPLFKCRVNNMFNVGVPFGEQSIINKENSKSTSNNFEDYIAIENTEKLERIKSYEEIYYTIFKNLFIFAKNRRQFTLKDFINNLIENDKATYLKITSDAYVFRNAIMYFALVKNKIEVKKILKILENINFEPDFEFQIERMFERLYEEDKILAETYEGICIKQIINDEFKVNTEINIEELTAKSMEITNIDFVFIIDEEE